MTSKILIVTLLVLALLISVASSIFILSSRKPTKPILQEEEYVTTKIGENVKIDGVSFKVNSVKTSKLVIVDCFKFGKCLYSKSGEKFAIINVTFTNQANGKEFLQVYGAKLTVNEGTTYERFFISTVVNKNPVEASEEEITNYFCEELFSSVLLPGESINRCMFFQVPEDTQPTELSFNVMKGTTSQQFVVELV